MNDQSSERFTLITGASAGIGRALAVESARRGRNLILVSLPDEGLPNLAADLEIDHRVKVKFVELNLTEDGSCRKIFEWCEKEKLRVDRLINNAGLGMGGPFQKYTDNYYEKSMFLNMTAPVALIRMFLPSMQELDKAWILNTGSMAGFFPIPYKTVYAASKSFLLYLTLGLQEELKGSGIQLSILCPNAVPTNDDVKQRIKSAGWMSRITIQTPEKIAQLALDKMEKDKTVIIPGFVNKLSYIIKGLVPFSLRAKIIARVFRHLS